MKKSLLALAVLGAFATGAQAQTNVSIGGIVQAEIKNYKISNTTAAGRVGKNELRVDDDYNSRFWLTGTEDLGGGLSALFYVENRFNTDQRQSTGAATGAGLADGDTFVGLKGSFGQVTVGKHSWMSVQGLTTEFMTGTNGFSAMPTSMTATYSILNQAGGYLDITRRTNSITYRSPVISGFSGVVGVSTASAGNEGNMACTAGGLINAPGALTVAPVAGVNTATCPLVVSAANGNNTRYSDGREYYLQAGYNNGPLALGAAYRDFTAEGRTGIDDKQLRLTGSYKIAGFKVGLMYDRAERQAVANDVNVGGKVKRNAWSVPVSYAFGNSTILASYTRAGDLTGLADTGAKMYTLGYDYALSKRTNVGVFYSRLDNDANGIYQPFLAGTSFTGSAPSFGETASTFALGVKHTF